MVGKTLAHYEILEPLGAGGMGEVYRARDPRLDRDVAIKVLPEDFAADAERLARFEREAKLLAQLNHANIATIHGLEDADGVRFIAMECVEGKTLAERLATEGRLDVDEALEVARQIAEALEAAHESGVVHRDLKPANVKVTVDGRVKVLDFGLAKGYEADGSSSATSPDLSHSPTTDAATRSGVILGTAAYMSPEQARGKPVDKRSDIWAFGCVLYELLAGQPSFGGETVSDTLAAILKEEPDWARLPTARNTAIDRLLRRCLEKDQRERLRDIGEARIAIANAIQDPSGAGDDESDTEVGAPVAFGRWGVLALVGGALLGFAAGWSLVWRAPDGDLPLRKFEIVAGAEDVNPVVSPDGTMVAWADGESLWVQRFVDFEPRRIDGAEGAAFPFWSPDSDAIGYFTDTHLMRVSLTASSPAPIGVYVGGLSSGVGASWADDDNIYFSVDVGPLQVINARGGDPSPVFPLDEGAFEDVHTPHVLPDGAGVVYTLHSVDHRPNVLELWDGSERRVLLETPDQSFDGVVYSPTGHLLYRRTDNNPGVWAVPFSLASLSVEGEPFLVASGGRDPSVGGDGTLAYLRPADSGSYRIGLFDADGDPVRQVGEPVRGAELPALSPDGSRVAFGTTAEGTFSGAMIISLDLETGVSSPVSSNGGAVPTWSPDGNSIAYVEGPSLLDYRVFVADVAGANQPRVLAIDGDYPSFHPNGETLIYTQNLRNQFGLDQRVMSVSLLDPDAQPKAVIESELLDSMAVVSPDGNLIAWVRERPAGAAFSAVLMVATLPDIGAAQQASSGAAWWPRWSADSARLYFTDGAEILGVEVEARDPLRLSRPEPRLTLPAARQGLATRGARVPASFAVSDDGGFVLLVPVFGDMQPSSRIRITQNWAAEFGGAATVR